jgi:hypothetical protein
MSSEPSSYNIIAAATILFAAAPVTLANTVGSFFVNWTDRVGNAHPLVASHVTLYDSDNGVETPIGTWSTNSIGRLTFDTNYVRPGGGPLQIVLDVKAVVTNVGTAGVQYGGTPFAFRLPGAYAFNANSFGTVHRPPAVTNTSDAGKAIGFMQGLKVASDHFTSLGASTPYAQVRFAPQWGNGSFMNGQLMNLGYDSWGAWDVAFHEFAHGVADLSGLDAEPHIGSAHSFNQDNVRAGPALGAAGGTQFAWQEGIATYMGTAALKNRLPLAFPNMPPADYNESYDRFSSTGSTTPDSSATFSVHVENRSGVIPPNTFIIPGRGEGDELSIARILWDLEDDTPGESFPRGGRADQVAIGAQAVYDLMSACGAADDARLSGLWRAACDAYGATPHARSLLGDLFEANAVSAIPGASGGVADGGITASPTPTLAWTPQNAGNSDAYLVAIYSEDWSTLVRLSPQIDDATLWRLATPLDLGTYNWVVISNSCVQNGVSFDDSYWSGAASFTVAPEPGALALAACLPFVFGRARRGRAG